MSDTEKQDKTVEVDVAIKNDQIPEIIEEAVAKYFENQAVREKRFRLTEGAVDEANAVEGAKFKDTIKFLNAMKEGDVSYLKSSSDTRAKALNESTGNQGGFLVPEEFERGIVMYMDEFNTIRRNATVLPMSSDVKRLNELTSRVQVFVEGELATATYSEPTFGEPVLTARRYTGLTSMSEELLADSEIALIDNLQRQFAQEMGLTEENQFVNGTFSGGEGLLEVAGTTPVPLAGTATTFSALTWDDLAAMEVALFNVSELESRTAKFYMSMDVYNILRTKKSTGDGNYFNLPTVPSDADPARAWGHQIEVTNRFPRTTATGTKFVVFSDLRNHAFIGDRAGLRIDSFNSGTVNSTNLITQYARALRAVKRTAFTTALESGIVTLATN